MNLTREASVATGSEPNRLPQNLKRKLFAIQIYKSDLQTCLKNVAENKER